MARDQRLELTWYNKGKSLLPAETGKYGYVWIDPRDPRYSETRLPDVYEEVIGRRTGKSEGITYSERADLEPQVDNLLILGESGDVLKILAYNPEFSHKYLGKTKCVYIDPPFNTAKTFASYEDNIEHSVWLTMMRDRLLVFRELLDDDGTIWVHLDHVENHRMRLLLDEVFGSKNFIAEVIWQKTYSPRNDKHTISSNNDFILVYGKNKDVVSLNGLERTESSNKKYGNPDGDARLWRSDNNSAPHNATSSGKQVKSLYGIRHPLSGKLLFPSQGRQWAFKRSRIISALSEFAEYREVEPDLELRSKMSGLPIEALDPTVLDLEIRNADSAVKSTQQRIQAGSWPEFFPNREGFGRKTYLENVRKDKAPETVWLLTEVGHTDGANKEIQALFPGVTAFSTPKPEKLLERIIHIASNPGDIVIDVFGGSGTTAAVAQKMGRQWVTCELLEDTFQKFTRPRLEKVVNGDDMGGVSSTKGVRIDATVDGLPEELSPVEAQQLTSLLRKALKGNPQISRSNELKQLRRLVKTVDSPDQVNWLGGGGFSVAKVARPCFNYLPELGLTVLTEHATGKTLVRSIAANLGFELSDGSYFNGHRNREMLAVIEGFLDTTKIDDIMAHLPRGFSVLIAATELSENARQHVRDFKNGSRVIHVPLDMFPFSNNAWEA